jgi:fructose-1,6-bisphosphatase/inositol monophosphatase family enzyme
MAWILLPARGVMLIAERGAGATRNDVPLRTAAARSTPVHHPDRLVAVLKTKYLDAATREHVLARADGLGAWSAGSGCAATEYHDLVAGPTDAIFWGQTHPWDHAPGCLIVTEAGGVAARWDGDAYHPGVPGFGLTVAQDPSRWAALQAEVGPPTS